MTLIGKTLFAGIPRRKGRLSQRALHQNDIQSSYLATLKRVTSLISNTQFLISISPLTIPVIRIIRVPPP